MARYKSRAVVLDETGPSDDFAHLSMDPFLRKLGPVAFASLS
jgi:hypothetical protein